MFPFKKLLPLLVLNLNGDFQTDWMKEVKSLNSFTRSMLACSKQLIYVNLIKI